MTETATHRIPRTLVAVGFASAPTGCTTFDSTLGMGDLVAAAPPPGVDPFMTGSVSAEPAC